MLHSKLKYLPADRTGAVRQHFVLDGAVIGLIPSGLDNSEPVCVMNKLIPRICTIVFLNMRTHPEAHTDFVEFSHELMRR